MFLYLPATHARQEPPFAPEYPGLHWQLCTEVLPSESVLEFSGHLVHTPLPALVEYVPILHGVHTRDPKKEYVPALHEIQLLIADAPGMEDALPTGQFIQVLI